MYEAIRRGASGGVQPNLNLSIVGSLQVPLPPLVEQERICFLVENLLQEASRLAATTDANATRLERLRQAVLCAAFSGQLVPQDPTDEPASVLLERIRAGREDSNKQRPARRNRKEHSHA